MGAARTNQLKLDAGGAGSIAKAKPVEPPSTMRVNMKIHDMGDVRVGKTYKMKVHAKVVGHHQDEFGHHASLEIAKLDMGNDSSGK